MADLALQFGGDLMVGPTGDLLLSDGMALTQQRVLRRLLTNPGDYIWQLKYGGGLGQFVGQTGAPGVISAIARAQILMEDDVARSPAPTVSASFGNDGTLVLSIGYVENLSGQTAVLNFSL